MRRINIKKVTIISLLFVAILGIFLICVVKRKTPDQLAKNVIKRIYLDNRKMQFKKEMRASIDKEKRYYLKVVNTSANAPEPLKIKT